MVLLYMGLTSIFNVFPLRRFQGMPFSLHSHSGQFCKHASGSLEEVVLEAIRQKFVVYGLSEHVPRYRIEDRYPEEEDITLQQLATQFDAFIEEAHRLKTHYSKEITILVGAETEYITSEDLTGLAILLDRHGGKIEYLVGSVHHVNEIPIDFDKPTFERALQSLDSRSETRSSSLVGLLSIYLDAQFQLLTTFHPEVIGHFDLCRLYHPDLKFHQYPEVLKKIERNVIFACEYGALFEFNAAAFRKGWDSAYPGRDIVELVSKLGGRFTLSDDSHGPHAVGLNYDKLYTYLKELGIKELWYLTNEESVNGGRHSRPVKLAGDWWLDGFWQSRDVLL